MLSFDLDLVNGGCVFGHDDALACMKLGCAANYHSVQA